MPINLQKLALFNTYFIVLASIICSFARNPQTITFPKIKNKTCKDSIFILNANSSAGLQITYKLTLGNDNAVINGNMLTLLNPGTVIIEASQVGNDDFEPAVAVVQQFEVSSQIFNPDYKISIYSTDSIRCEGSTFKLFTNSFPGITYTWLTDYGVAYHNNILEIQNISVSQSGLYRLKISEAKCAIYPFSIEVTVRSKPKVSINLVNKKMFISENPISLNGLGSPLGGTFSGIGTIKDAFYPTISGFGFSTIAYHYSDNFGCTNFDTASIEVKKDTIIPVAKEIIIYELITHKKESKHNAWFIENIEEYSENEVFVYDSWGTLVFRKKQYNNNLAWHGENIDTGNYVYIIDKGDGSPIKKGNLFIEK